MQPDAGVTQRPPAGDARTVGWQLLERADWTLCLPCGVTSLGGVSSLPAVGGRCGQAGAEDTPTSPLPSTSRSTFRPAGI